MQSEHVPTLSNRYTFIDQLGQGGMGSVYRVHDRLTNTVVAAKVLSFEPAIIALISSGGLDLRLALTREFQTLATLRHPNIVSVLDYGIDTEGQPFFTMEYLPEAETIVSFLRKRDDDVRMSVFWQALRALQYLHQHNILHRDLTPDNMLVLSDGTLKLLDFGLAFAHEEIEDQLGIGTLPYMAPETIQGEPHSQASDLYALGLVFYELISGAYPFPADTPDDLQSAIISKTLDVTALPTNEVFKAILVKLLEKSPEARYIDVDRLLADYTRLTGTPPPAESASVRDSFLQAARFVARTAELNQLERALKLLFDDSGSAWLIGGESGVGKSRLVDELRILALLRGVQVLHAQATSDTRATFQLWRQPLRVLLLDTEVSDMEASVLANIVTDIAPLIGRKVSPAPEIDAVAAKDRLVSVITDVFARQPKPILLLLEDLQWVSDGLSVVEQLVRLSRHRPLLIVGNFRDDERPELPALLPDMQFIKLKRLGFNEIGELTASMLGEQNGRRADLITYLQQQTEGNVFFVVETVRALAEEVGRLQAIGEVDLPANLIAVGVRDVIQRRVAQVAPADLRLMRIAALNGRSLDLRLLAAAVPQPEVDNWLMRNAAIFEVRETEWRFAHDKLREAVVAAVPKSALAETHRLVAQALEAVYHDNPDHTALQALHWGLAGDEEREMYYGALAGIQMLRQGASHEAMKLLERAFELMPRYPRPALWRAELARSLAEAAEAVGKLEKHIFYLKEALQFLGAPSLPVSESLEARLSTPIQVDISHISAEDRNAIIDLTLSLGFSYIEMLGDINNGVDAVLLATALQEPFGASIQLADCYALLATTLCSVGDTARAAEVAARAQEILAALGEPTASNLTLYARAVSNLAFYETFAARWDESVRDCQLAAQLYEQAGDTQAMRAPIMNLATSYEWRGDYRRGLEIRQQEYDTALRNGSLYGQVRALAGVGQLQAYVGDLESSLQSLTRRGELVAILKNTSSTRYTYMSMIYWRLGRVEEAKTALRQAVVEIGRIVVPVAHDMFSIQNVAEVLLGLWETDPVNADVYADYIPKSLALIAQYAERYASGEAQMRVLLGSYAWLRGETAVAMQTWRQALDLAVTRGNRFSEAFAHFEIARHLPDANSQRAAHIAQARSGFAQTGAHYDLKRLNAL